ncbi:M20/M25/M40 family metallo-hydrolase [Candidatus Pantoea persica]|uniref:M20/M25/M40 family metallo-hydrolase n=1 Tax=Candidatus Pantoea persica TaxID=2518128 RepID=UPI00215DAD00|nr:M20/M25/M40 family metallo-hydrolase [Candidatus Pantoea persica]MBA2814062.1 p-aminobenzoyl-glutamate hydrolase subunit B [Candidatus Pantoea persica]
MTEQKNKILFTIEQIAPQMAALARAIHARPELSFSEHYTSAALQAPLRAAGFDMTTGTTSMKTAFRSRLDSGEPGAHVVLLAEYDTLPELEHACGHNLIGTASVAAALALASSGVLQRGTLEVIGTPAEEEGGGKIVMADQGVFAGVDAVMMFHPREKNMMTRGALACVIQTFVGINALRQFFTDDVRVHGIITHGGSATNIVPAFAEAKFLMRAATVAGLQQVRANVFAAAQGAAAMSGARLEIEEGLTYAKRNNKHALAALFQANIEQLGLHADAAPAQGGVGFSDIGNVSQLTAAIHPYLRIGDMVPHTAEFTAAAASNAGIDAMLNVARALAMITFDLQHSAPFKAVRDEFLAWQAVHLASGENR